MVLGAMETPSSTSPTPTKNPTTTTNGTATSPKKKKNPPPSLYRECLKNHAASIGGHALDGCGEFMPSPAAVPSDPTSLKCAACGCHRNFHRRHSPEEPPHTNNNNKHFLLRHSPPFPPPPPPPPPHRNPSPSPSLSPSPGPTPSPTPSPQSPPPVSHLPPNSFFSSPAPPPPPPAQMLLALSTGERFSGESSRKRFRTKFTSEQKEKMTAFADRVGWRMQRSEEKLVEQFCAEIGVRKGVLKVWMHNNKHTLGKKPVLSAGVSGGSTANDNNNHDDVGADDDEKDEEAKSSLNFFPNGSSSTS